MISTSYSKFSVLDALIEIQKECSVGKAINTEKTLKLSHKARRGSSVHRGKGHKWQGNSMGQAPSSATVDAISPLTNKQTNKIKYTQGRNTITRNLR